GYLHTGIEKNTEVRNWTQGVTFVTRADYLASFFNEAAYCMSVERLLGAMPPPRAQAIRVFLMELNRIASHLVWLATGGMELGALSMMLYGFREREQILDIFEFITGLRMNHAFIRPGGLSTDLPDGTLEKVKAFVDAFPAKVDEYEELLTENQIWIDRNRGVGILEADVALGLGVTGPLLRAAGVPHDLRKQTPYSGYEKYDFDVATKTAGEWPRGELGYHIVSTGGTKPWRVHGRDPSFVNLQAMPHMVRGRLIADVIASVASIDPVMGGVDR